MFLRKGKIEGRVEGGDNFSTSTSNSTIPNYEDFKIELEDFKSKQKEKAKNRILYSNTIYRRFCLTDTELSNFLEHNDFEWWCILLSGVGSLHDDLYYKDGILVDRNLDFLDSKGAPLKSIDEYVDYFCKKFSNKPITPPSTNIVPIIEIDLSKIVFDEKVVSFKLLREIFSKKHESEVDVIRSKTIKFIKYFSGLFQLYANSPYILKTVTKLNGFESDVEMIHIARLVNTEISYKRYQEICTYFYKHPEYRTEFSIMELVKNWSLLSHQSNFRRT